ncbi:Uncharacterised protein [Bordetella pertussis]|nr:Uncharacterised protein [Bordetella pertussis]
MPGPAASFQRARHLLAVQRAGREHRQRHRLAGGQGGAVARGHPAQRLGPVRLAVRVHLPLLDQQQVELAIAVAPQQLVAQAAVEFQPQQRIARQQRREHGHQRRAHEVLRRAQPQHGVALGRGHAFARLVGQPQDAARIAQQALAFLGGQHVALAAVQQPAAQVFLQADHVLADRGLGQVQVFAGAREVAGIHHRDEAAQQYGIEHRVSH